MAGRPPRLLAARLQPAMNAPYYTQRQAVRRLGIGQLTLNRWVRAGQTPPPIKVWRRMNRFDHRAIGRLARRGRRSSHAS